MTISRAPVTFLMPVKNGALYLIDSLNNIQKMAEPNDEILVVDDASMDETPSILRGFTSQRGNLVILDNPKPGLVNALNLGVKESQHKIIARVDVDDVYPSDRISKQIVGFENSTVAMFSDDVESAKELLNSLELKFIYLAPPIGVNPLESLILMSKCIGVITANSSFSWWAGALATNAKQVIAPSKWFKTLRDPDDLIPENWTKVASSWE